MSSHNQYERLCALAVAGELTGKEFAEFESHREHCVACQRQMLSLTELSVCLSVHAGQKRGTATPKGMQDRFRERAIRQGIPLCSKPVLKPASRLLQVGLTTAVLAVVILVARVKPTHFETRMAGTDSSVDGNAKPDRAALTLESESVGGAKGDVQAAMARSSQSPLKFVATKPHTLPMRRNSGPQRSGWTLGFILPPSLLSGNRVQDSITTYRPEHGYQLALHENPKCSAWTVEGERVSAPWERVCMRDEKPTFHYDASVLDLHPFADSKSVMKTAAFSVRLSRPSTESFQ